MRLKPIKEALIQVHDILHRKQNGVFLYSDVGNIENTVRYGKIIEVPMLYNTILKKGDVVYFHHNIVRRTYAMNHTMHHGYYEIDRSKGLFLCPLSEIFAIERNGKIEALDPYCFVKPVKAETVKKKNGVYVVDGNVEIPFLGVLKYGNKDLKNKGILEGDKVIFREWSMYEFKINGEKLYRMKSKRILGQWNE